MQNRNNGKALAAFALAAPLAVMLAGCESAGLSAPSLPSMPSLFADKPPEKLPGRRISVLRTGEKEGLAAPEVAVTVSLPPALANASWSQAGGTPSNAPGHLALGGSLKKVWSADAGEGSSKRTRITAIPIVYENKVFTLDAKGTVRAISAANGGTVWSVSLVPADEKASSWNPFNSSNTARAGFGGGLAADGGKVFAASGFGTVVAFEPGSGKVLWTKKLTAPIRQAPSAADGRVFVVTSEAELFCLSAADGSELWTQRGLPESASLLSNSNPAVSGNLVFVPYPSGEVVALDVKTGASKWTETLAKSDLGSSSTAIGDAARPVADRDLVFAVSRGGSLIATSRDKGSKVWSRDIASSQTPYVAGDAIFVVDVTGKLVALGRKDGKIRWLTQLPDSGIWSGPVLAGGKLWLASSKGMFVAVDATNGSIANESDLGNPVTITPVVADGKMFVLTDSAQLIAMN
jgi:outer membrane protein assembly factor BamB